MLQISLQLLLEICIITDFLATAYGHVALVFPPARKYDLDFLDNLRTPEPCGMPRGNITTSFLSGSQFNVSWHLSYAHRGGFRLQIMDSFDRPLIDLTPVTQLSEFVNENSTNQYYFVQLPLNFTCHNCTIRLMLEAREWGSNNKLWSCADVDILDRATYREDCSGHGKYLVGRCKCDRRYYGTRCEFADECVDNSDCGTQGVCIDNGGTTFPKKQCYCNIGWFGSGCSLRSSIKTVELDLDSHKMIRFSDEFIFYWRILENTKEIEVVLVVNGTSWVGIGWRPSNLKTSCRMSQSIYTKSEINKEVNISPKSRRNQTTQNNVELFNQFNVEPTPDLPNFSAKKRLAKSLSNGFIANSEIEYNDVTMQTSVTYRVSTKQKRKKRALENSDSDVPGLMSKQDFNAMECTDMVIGMAKGNVHKINDYYSRDRSTPRTDVFWGGKNSLTAAMGFESNGITTIAFRRKLESNEWSDYKISDGDMLVIWAKGQPANEANVNDFYKPDEFKYHGHRTQRGYLTLNFFGLNNNFENETDKIALQERKLYEGEWKYPRSCSIKNENCEYYISWNYKQKTDQIMFTIVSKNTDTWTGIGFSNDEKMSQTDAVIGWVDNISGRPFLMDTWISGYNSPLLDASQDVHNISGKVENGMMTLMFSRKRITNDNKDLSFSNDHCLYMVFPVKGGMFNSINKKIRKHTKVPIVSAEKICIKSYQTNEEMPDYALSSNDIYIEVEVKFLNFADNIEISRISTQEYNFIASKITDDISSALQNELPEIMAIKLKSFTRNKDRSYTAKIDIYLLNNKSNDELLYLRKPHEIIEKTIKKSLKTGKIGSFAVDPHYLNVILPSEFTIYQEKFDEHMALDYKIFDPTDAYMIIGSAIALSILALIQASYTFHKRVRNLTKKDQLIENSNWKDAAINSKMNFGLELYESEAKIPPFALINVPKSNDTPESSILVTNQVMQHYMKNQNNQQLVSASRVTHSLPRTPGPKQESPLPQPNYYTQDRRNNRAKNSKSNHQPDFYFMPSQRKYSGEIVRVYVDYENQNGT